MEIKLFKDLAEINSQIDRDLILLDNIGIEAKLHKTFKNNKELSQRLSNINREFEYRSSEYKTIASNYEGKLNKMEEDLKIKEKEVLFLKEEIRILNKNSSNAEKAYNNMKSNSFFK